MPVMFARRVAAALLVWSSVTALLLVSDPLAAAEGEGGLVGAVVDVAGEPVAGASVIAYPMFDTDEVGYHPKSSTDGAGRFEIDAVPGVYEIQVRLDGFHPQTIGYRSGWTFNASRSDYEKGTYPGAFVTVEAGHTITANTTLLDEDVPLGWASGEAWWHRAKTDGVPYFELVTSLDYAVRSGSGGTVTVAMRDAHDRVLPNRVRTWVADPHESRSGTSSGGRGSDDLKCGSPALWGGRAYDTSRLFVTVSISGVGVLERVAVPVDDSVCRSIEVEPVWVDYDRRTGVGEVDLYVYGVRRQVPTGSVRFASGGRAAVIRLKDSGGGEAWAHFETRTLKCGRNPVDIRYRPDARSKKLFDAQNAVTRAVIRRPC